MKKYLKTIDNTDYFCLFPDLEYLLFQNRESLRNSFVGNLVQIYDKPVSASLKEYWISQFHKDDVQFASMIFVPFLFVTFSAHFKFWDIQSDDLESTILLLSLFICFVIGIFHFFTTKTLTFLYQKKHLSQLIFLNLFYEHLKYRIHNQSRDLIFIELLNSPEYCNVFETLSQIPYLSELEKLIGLNFPTETLIKFNEISRNKMEFIGALDNLQGNIKTLQILLSNESEIPNYISEKIEHLKESNNVLEVKNLNEQVKSLIVSASQMSLSADVLKTLK